MINNRLEHEYVRIHFKAISFPNTWATQIELIEIF